MRDSKFMAEEQEYNWYELQEEVEEGRFDADKVEELQWKKNEKGEKVPNADLLSQNFKIFESILFIKIKNKFRRVVVWYSKERRTILRIISFPYDHGRPYYIPFFITNDCPGFLQPGLGRILQPQNIVANAIQNFTLDNGFYRNTAMIRVDPNSRAASQLMQKSYKIGDTIVANQGEIEKFDMNTGGMNDMFTLQVVNERMADDATGVSSATLSGRSDPIDPDAPAKKTMALRDETNINVKSYIMNLLPSFQELCYQLLQLTGQFKDKTEFKRKREAVVGAKPITITAEQCRTRTNLTPNAYSFEFDKVNEKRLNLSLAQLFTTNPIFAPVLQQSPKSVQALGKKLIKSWSNEWSMAVNEIWPTPEMVLQQQVEIQKEAMRQVIAETQGGQMQMQRQPMQRPMPPQQGAPNPTAPGGF
jgi:hypothetical protein